ncbi:MAG: hypothetical protein WCC04_15855 [Terriglobales bacterium]
MDRQIDEQQARVGEKRSRYDSSHLMCRTSLWGVAGFMGCVYFVWISFGHIAHHELEWPHDAWTASTYAVWIVLLGLLSLNTSCLRERAFFVFLLINFFIGFALTLWSGVPSADVRTARLVTGALWAAGAVMSLTTVRRAGKN